ncbi:hypothetical protein NP493_239g00027 [Ridgeia piscesae]|uniref:Tyrosine-protein phosphatase domain-containing protein n=1 Tax=Ridgeia piscesae TaxID=27915 RepID=A0AAD9NZN1_RIDPI|nr:hypothetical protein NP493_239g00027 [Ridgeia piscesae]
MCVVYVCGTCVWYICVVHVCGMCVCVCSKKWWCSLRDFTDRLNGMTSGQFAEELQSLQSVDCDLTTTAAQLEVNRPKNRYTDVLPYDVSRIKLMTAESQDGSDYLNGSWVPVGCTGYGFGSDYSNINTNI